LTGTHSRHAEPPHLTGERWQSASDKGDVLLTPSQSRAALLPWPVRQQIVDAPQREICNTLAMITYTVIPTDSEAGFHVKIAGSEGNRQTILGFATESDAEAWIASDKRLTDETSLFATPSAGT
jgi:hypothetical protein